ncbi:MAG: sodium:solute symporter family protein [Melioribacteraceae bacterium]|nr:sodium:solute symporter family protein [Melioribacteraceae bacterium]
MNALLIGIFVYIVLQLAIGFIISKKIKNETDYLLGGRSLGYPLATFSIFATWFGAESCIGTAGAAYSSGLAGVRADPFGYGICLILVGLLIAVPLYKMKLTTVADFFRIRYSAKAERVTAVLMIPTSLLWAAAQIRAFGLILSSTSDLNITLAISISAFVVIVYTVFGGLLADAWTDIIQGSILIIGLLILVPVIVIHFGGIEETIKIVDKERLSFMNYGGSNFFHNTLLFLESWSIPICGSLVAQEAISRVLASKNQKVAKRSALAAGSFYIMIGFIPLSIGLIGYNLFPGLSNEEQVLSLVAQKFLPSFLYIVFIGALVSAILSTVDSSLLACSALLSHNLVIPAKKNITEKGKLFLERSGVVIMGVLAFVLAVYAEGVYQLVKDASAFGSSGIFILMIIGIFTKYGNSASAVTALIAGASTWIIGHYILENELSYVLSLSVSAITFWVVYKLTK